jgi:hypothetical protein
MSLALLVTKIVASPAMMPIPLPSYDVECRAGAMDGLNIINVNVSVRSDAEQRTGRVGTLTGAFDVAVRSTPMSLSDSIGGRGFVDEIEYNDEGYGWSLILSVRGQIADNIIPFHVTRIEGPSGMRRHKVYEGQCNLTSERHTQDVSP